MRVIGRRMLRVHRGSALVRLMALATLCMLVIAMVQSNFNASASTLGSSSSTTAAAPIDATLYGAPGSVTSKAIGPDNESSFNAWLPNGRRLTPTGLNVEVGENPLGEALTPDGKYLIVTNDDERNAGSLNQYSSVNGAGKVKGGYTLAIVDTATMKVVGVVAPTVNATPNPGIAANGKTQTDKNAALFLGVVALSGPGSHYTIYAAGGTADVVYRVDLDPSALSPDVPASVLVAQQIAIPAPTDRTKPNFGMAAPGGLALSSDRKRLYVVNNNANNVVTIDTTSNTVVGSPAQVGYFPYAATVAGGKLYVTNDGVAERAFSTSAIASEVVSSSGTNSFGTASLTGTVSLTGTKFIGGGTTANLFANPVTDAARSSSVSVLTLNSNGIAGAVKSAVSLLLPIDGIDIVGGTQPTGMALVGSVLYVADANEDALALIDTASDTLLGRVPLGSSLSMPGPLRGLTPNALAYDSSHKRLFVTEAGINAVAVYDVHTPAKPSFMGLLPTGWYPTGLTLGAGGTTLYVINAKGAGNPYTFEGSTAIAPDVNLMFGTAQKIDLSKLTAQSLKLSTQTVLNNNFQITKPAQSSILPSLQKNIKHIVYILRENKSYDSYFGSDAALNSKGADGQTPVFSAVDWGNFTSSTAIYTSTQVPNATGNMVQNTRALAEQFNVGDNFFADSEESDAGHYYALAGTTSDYLEKTLLQRGSRGFISVKNEDPEDYPIAGFIFNNAARSKVSYRDYGDLIRLSGYDDGNSSNACANDPSQGPVSNCPVTTTQAGQDVLSGTAGLGGLYTENIPALLALGSHIDGNYPGWNVHITDQRRAAEFIKDFQGLISKGQAPALTFVWLPEDHTGNSGGSNISPAYQVADNDAALGKVVQFISHSTIWNSTAIFVTADDAQSSWDHVYAHRTYAMVISPWAKHGQVVHTRGSTVSIPKTIDEILGMSPMNYGDLLGNDMLSYFTTVPDYRPYNPVKTLVAAALTTVSIRPEVARISALTNHINMSTYDTDNQRLGKVTALYMESSRLAQQRGTMTAKAYQAAQDRLYTAARAVVGLH